ncbi:hypothetical protein BGX27_003834 [Mortierella sp. AM989]|nr:hypothetical protein BGX27_003834 [Mortierella sp. AM989]
MPPPIDPMGNENLIPLGQATTSVSSVSSTPLQPSFLNADSKESKKFRPPKSIFDLPYPPRCAPPQDNKSFFEKMDSIEKALEEEDAGKIPKALEAGPKILVESLNKKRRRQLHVTETLLKVTSSPRLPFSPSPSLSSPSSSSIPSFDSFSSVSPERLENLKEDEIQPPKKKVRFNDKIQCYMIEARTIPPTRHSPRLHKSGRSGRSGRARPHGASRSTLDTATTSVVAPVPDPQVFRPDMLYDDDTRFRLMLNGDLPPPALEDSVAQLLSTVTTGEPCSARRREDALTLRAEAQQTTADMFNLEKNGKGKHKLKPSIDEENLRISKKRRQSPPKDDSEILSVGGDVLNNGDVGSSERDDESNRRNRSKDYNIDRSPGAEAAMGSDVLNQPVLSALPSDSLEMITIESSKESEIGKPDDLEDTENTVFDIPNPSIPRVSSPQMATVNIMETPAISNPKAPGRPKKGKETATTIATIIGSRRKQTLSQKQLTSGREQGNPARNVPSLRRMASVIELDGEDMETGAVAPTEHSRRISSSSSASLSSANQTSEKSKKGFEAQKSESAKTKIGPLSGLRLYVIPTNMDSRVFDITRKRVLDLSGSWLGPQVKILSTDPRTKAEIPTLDEETTTHIVTALTSIDDVKRFLKMDEINPKIPIVNREWLSDTIMYKTPMEPQSYNLRKIEQTVPLASLEDETPPPSLGRMNGQEPSQSLPGNQWLANDKSTDSLNQIEFNDIVQGIMEGSLDDHEISDIDEDAIENVKPEGFKEDTELSALETETNPTGSAEGTDLEESSDNAPQELTEEMKNQLRHENRCFRCKEVGHWANRCPHLKKPKPNSIPKDNEVLVQIINSGKAEGKRRKILYQCQSPHVAGDKDGPKYNKAILEQLKTLMDHYDTIKTKESKEHFKVINYRKAITAIRALEYELTSEEMALKVPRVGKKIAQKIGECVALGRIKKLNHLNWDKERSETETLFRSVYGVGSEKATEWYNKGLRTLDDLRKLPDLTKNQISGLRYYDDLLKRIPRSEVEKVGSVVESTAKALHTDIQSQVTGSYRRGKPDCGDIDIVVARPNVDNGDELFDIMEHILNDLTNQGFLVDHLSWPTWSDDMANMPKHFKYMGICKLPGDDQTHHHIDILVVPWIHLGAALLYFTGNDICNRSMRLYASKRGMHLSDKGLFSGIIRGPKRVRVNQGHWVAGRTEREIFEYLGIGYLEPYEREC